MIKKLTYQQKLKFSGFFAILLLIICYKLSFSRTIEQYRTFRQYQRTFLANNQDLNALHLLKAKNNYLQQILNRFILDTADQTRNLLTITGEFCDENDLRIEEYKPYPVVQRDSLSILMRSVTLSGKFTSCLKLIYFLETRSDAGRVGSVQFKSIALPSRSETSLTCTIFIQNLMTEQNEKK